MLKSDFRASGFFSGVFVLLLSGRATAFISDFSRSYNTEVAFTEDYRWLLPNPGEPRHDQMYIIYYDYFSDYCLFF